MKILFTATLVAMMSLSTAQAETALVASDGTYLGCLSCNKYDSDSVWNTYGTYGNKYSAKSIFNEYGTYGSRYSDQSIYNPYATNTPFIVGDAYKGNSVFSYYPR